MIGRGAFFAAMFVSFGTAFPGCIPPEEYNTQSFEAGEAICLSGKQLYFGIPPDALKSAPWFHFSRYAIEQGMLPEDAAGHDVVDFSRADPFEWKLPTDITFYYYNQRFDTLYIGSDGTIAFGTMGTGNDTLLHAFSSDQVSLLPVDAAIEGATVRYAVADGKLVVTYQNVAGSTFQGELFFGGDVGQGYRFTYLAVSDKTLAGVVGIPDRFHTNILISDSIEQFLVSWYTESNLCVDSPLN